MPDDLTIEVTGSAEKAASALDKIIQKITDLQERFDKAAPSVSKFASQMEQIASSSKAFQAFQKMADGLDKQALSAKNAESKMAMYQARLDRANASMERSRAQSEKLAAAQRKSLAIEQAAANVERLRGVIGNRPTTQSVWPETESSAIPPDVRAINQRSKSEAAAFNAAVAARVHSGDIPININADAATAELRRMGDYIDGLTPQISNMSAEAQAQFDALAEKLNLVSQQIDNQRMLYRSLADQAARVGAEQGEGSVAYLRLEKRMLSADAAAQRLGATQEKLQAQLSSVASGAAIAGDQMEKAGRKSASGWYRTLDMFGRMLIRIAAFKVYSAIAQGITTGLQDMALANSQANAAMSALSTNALYLKNSLGAALMPVLQAITPLLNQVTDALVGIFNAIGMLTARIFNHASTAVIAKRANVDYAATLDKIKASADAARKSMMGFDELNILNEQKANEGISSPGMPSQSNMFETVKVPDWVQKVGRITDKIQGMIRTNIDTMMRMLRMAPLVIGAILAFSGANIPLGIGLMAVGAVLMAKQAKEDWDYLTSKTNNSLDKLKRGLAIVGATELAIGAVIAFSGANVPLGIALMIGGITTTAATLNWDSMSPQIKKSMGAITFASAAAMLALGSVLTFSGANIPLGIGLLISGATTMWASSTLNWGTMSAQVKQQVGAISAIAGGALLALGLILTLTGVALPLGIGLIAAGAVSLGSAAALNWDSIKGKIKTVLTDILTIASLSSIAIGLILCLTGGGIPLGVGLILAGIAGTRAASLISGKPLVELARGVVNDIAGVFRSGMDRITAAYDRMKRTLTAGLGAGGIGFVGGGGGYGGGGGGGIRNASGTAFHPGGPALVNDQLGPVYQELVSLPTGLSFVPNGRNVLIPDLPRGSSILNATQTQQLLPKYAEGTGGFTPQPIQRQDGQLGNGAIDTDRILDRMDRMEKAIREIKVYLYTDDRKIAESANRGNRLLGRTFPTA